MLLAYAAQLNARAEAKRAKQRAEREKRAYMEAKAARERLTPLEDRLRRVLATIPANVQREGLSLPSLQTALRGRWRGNAHPGHVGASLRKLGYTRRRQWRSASGFRALWYPD